MSTHFSSLVSAIPLVLTSFVGREREIAEVSQLLLSGRLLSLIGPGGCGKTRLALSVVAEAEYQFVDGVCWVELARVSDSAFVARALAKALEIVEQPEVPLPQTLLEKLTTRQILLVLDNCEHLLSACAELLKLLLNAPMLKVLLTSREPLGIQGEVRYSVPPLALPKTGQPFVELAQSESMRLFVERARSVRAEFALTPENAELLAGICRRLDGLPLAIELASARINVLSLPQLKERLGHLDLLTSTAHSDQRHHTLRSTIDWSYQLLSPSERLLLQRLGVFAAGFGLGTVEAVCAWGELEDLGMLELLTSLINKSLVVVENLDGGEARYRLLETIRQFASEQLEASGGWQQTHHHYLESFLQLAEEIAPKLNQPHQQQWLDWLEREQDNLGVALAWAWQQQRYETGLRLAIALVSFWDARGYAHEGCTWLERLLKMPAEAATRLPLELRVNALTFASFLAMFIFDVARCSAWAEEAVRLCEAAGETGQPLLSLALAGLDSAFRAAGDWQTSLGLLKRSLELLRTSSDPPGRILGMNLYVLGMTEAALGHHAEAHHSLDEALRLAVQDGDTHRTAIIYNALGDLARFERRFAAALPHYEHSLELFHQAGASRLLPTAQRNFAYACLRVGDTKGANTLLKESLETLLKRDDRMGILRGLLGFAALAAAVGQSEASACLEGFVRGYRKTPMVCLESGDNADDLDDAHFAALVRNRISEMEFETAQSKGRGMNLDQAVAFALGLAFQAEEKRSHDLTRRERDLAGLIGAGLSNGDIAARLELSKRTVEKHIANILLKLEFKTRAQIVRWAMEQGLSVKTQ